ncbi:hypothetical protein JCM3775_001021 [Rhodotorula graminis]
MASSESAAQADGGSSRTVDHPPPTPSTFTFLAPTPFSFGSAAVDEQSSHAGQGASSGSREGRPPRRSHRAGGARGVQGAGQSDVVAVKVRDVAMSGERYEERGEGATSGADARWTSAGLSEGEGGGSSDDRDSPRRPRKRVCRRPPFDPVQHLIPPASPPLSGPLQQQTAARSPPPSSFDDPRRPSSTSGRHSPRELAFYADSTTDSTDSDEDSCGAPLQPLSDAETSGENQLRRTPPRPHTLARSTLSPIDNTSSTDSSTRHGPAPSASPSSTRAHSTARRRMSSPARTALAASLSALDLVPTSYSDSEAGSAALDEREGISSDEWEGASVEEEQVWRFEECPVGSFASTSATAW